MQEATGAGSDRETIMQVSFRLLTHSEVSGDQEKALLFGRLVKAAFPDFYNLIPLPEQEICRIVGAQVALPGTELEETYVLRRSGADVAILSAINSGKLELAQVASLVAICRQLEYGTAKEFREALTGFRQQVEPVDLPSIYLPRLSVLPEARGTGAGKECMRRLINLYGGGTYTLHVHRDNNPIISLHTQLGFAFVSDQSYRYRLMALTC
jgi:ribosomal protein S18 acetylase RimI-like enzyme